MFPPTKVLNPFAFKISPVMVVVVVFPFVPVMAISGAVINRHANSISLITGMCAAIAARSIGWS